MDRIRDDTAALAERIAAICKEGFVVFDGCYDAGKTYTMREVAKRIRCETVDMDAFLHRSRGMFVAALKLEELAAAVREAKKRSPLVLVSGVCARDVMQRIGITEAVFAYIQRITPTGIPGDGRAYLADKTGISEFGKILPDQAGALDREVEIYHANFRPIRTADIVYQRTSD